MCIVQLNFIVHLQRLLFAVIGKQKEQLQNVFPLFKKQQQNIGNSVYGPFTVKPAFGIVLSMAARFRLLAGKPL